MKVLGSETICPFSSQWLSKAFKFVQKLGRELTFRGALENTSARHAARPNPLKLSDGKNRVQKTLQEWPIIGKEIYVSNVNHLHDHCVIKFCITLEQFPHWYKLELR